MSAENKVSFTVRRPTPVSRAGSSGADSDSSFKIPALPRHITNGSNPSSPLARSTAPSPKPKPRGYGEQDSSDEEEATEDELVTGFDQFGVQRLHERKVEPKGPLVIPALKNRDWRELARKRKALYVPPSAAATTGADGSVGGLGTKDTINSGPQLTGLQMKKRIKLENDGEVELEETIVAEEAMVEGTKEEETEDQKALRAILASADDPMGDGPQVDIIPVVTEDDAFKQDVEELPEPATLDDYERVPVSQFGAALLRGMGWKEGTAASKKNKGMVEPWLPQARPALLGIGAKEKEVYDDGSAKGKKKGRPEKRYVPVIKKEREGSREGSANGNGNGNGNGVVSRRSPSPDRRGSRRSSRSPGNERRRDREGRDRGSERDRERDRERRRDDRRDYDSSRRERERDKDRRRDRSADRYDRDSDGHRRDRDRRR